MKIVLWYWFLIGFGEIVLINQRAEKKSLLKSLCLKMKRKQAAKQKFLAVVLLKLNFTNTQCAKIGTRFK